MIPAFAVLRGRNYAVCVAGLDIAGVISVPWIIGLNLLSGPMAALAFIRGYLRWREALIPLHRKTGLLA